MPDLGPVVAPLASLLVELVKPAVGALLRTTAGMIGLSVILASGSGYLAAQGSTTRGILAVILTLVVCGIIGGILAMKRAVLTALISGVARLDLGGRVLGLVFDKILGVSDGGTHGERGGVLAKTAERLPLAEAETRLGNAVSSLTSQAGSGWFVRKIQSYLVQQVQRVTLARFRSEGQQQGGIDLLKVRDELATQIDGLLVDHIEGMLMKITMGLVLLSGALSVCGALLIRRLPI